MKDIATAFARYLESKDILVFDEEGGQDGDCFWGYMPDQPDAAVMVTPTGGDEPSGTLAYDSPHVQFLVRSPEGDPRPGFKRAKAIQNALNGLHHTTIAEGTNAEVYVVGCKALSSDPSSIGEDDNGRHEFSINFAVEVAASSEHRI